MLDKDYERKNFFRRLRLYLFGVSMGCVLVYFLLWRGRDMSFWTPNNRILDDIRHAKITYSAAAKCKLKCLDMTKADVNVAFKYGSVDFSKFVDSSRIKYYTVLGGVTQDISIKLSLNMNMDTVVRIIDISRVIAKDTCTHCNSND
ncbi:MAG TPA: hypothetical protein VI112_01905 [Bacteroidia bacterium]|jgi:hypothetical protein